MAGCLPPDDEVARAMDRALEQAHEALAVSLVADELLVHAHETPDTQLRHGTDGCGCPCTERTGEPPWTFLLTLDYHDTACVPESGLIPAVLSGRAVLTVSGDTVDATPDALTLGYEHPLEGRIDGQVSPATLETTIGGALRFRGRDHALDLRVEQGGDGLTLEGWVRSGSADLALEGVHLPRERLALPCPTPVGGRMWVSEPDQEPVGIDFETPGGGQVTAERGRSLSDPAPWCAFDAGLW
jgi:hypothetical protein